MKFFEKITMTEQFKTNEELLQESKYYLNEINPLVIKYIDISKYDITKIPTFAKDFFMSNCSDEDKELFYQTVLIRYLEDRKFRKEIQNWYIYTVDDKYIGIYGGEEASIMSNNLRLKRIQASNEKDEREKIDIFDDSYQRFSSLRYIITDKPRIETVI
jgi:hypothetical protein